MTPPQNRGVSGDSKMRYRSRVVRCFVVLLSALPLLAVATEPGEVALAYAEKIRAGAVNLEAGADTAITNATLNEKRRVIASRLAIGARELNDRHLEIGPIRQNGPLAAALVFAHENLDPGSCAVLPIALVEQDGKWLPAPSPGSFENTAAAYDASRSKVAVELESWMAGERILALNARLQNAAARLREEISGQFPAQALRTNDPKQVLERFVRACEERDEAAMLACLGGLQEELPDQWGERLQAVRNAIGNPTMEPWSWVMGSEAIRVILPDESNQGEAVLTLAVLAPASSGPSFHLPTFRLSRSAGGLWRIDPAPAWLSNGENASAPPQADASRVREFPPLLAGRLDIVPISHSGLLNEKLQAALQSKTPESLLSLLDLRGEPGKALRDCEAFARLWKHFHQPGLRYPQTLSFHQTGDTATTLFQCFDAKEPRRTDLKAVHFRKKDDTWFLGGDETPSPETAAWLRAEREAWQTAWQGKLLENSAVLPDMPADDEFDATAIRAAAETWFRALGQGEVQTALSSTARFADARSRDRLLRNLGYEWTSFQRSGKVPQIIGIHRQGGWALVVARLDLAEGEVYPCYPVVQTSSGPRLAIELDLFAAGKRSREFLNQASFSHLAAITNEKTATVLRELFLEAEKDSKR